MLSHILKKTLILMLLLVGAVLLVGIWPWPSYDIAQVHPRLRNLRTPYQSVRCEYYLAGGTELEGGSVGVEIVDRDGHKLQAALPVSHDMQGNRRYDRLYLGVMHLSETGAVDVVQVEAPEHSKRLLIRAIAAYSRHDSSRGCALDFLRGGSDDHADLADYIQVLRDFFPTR